MNALPLVDEKRIVTTGGHYAYMKIAEGCDKHCTYCIIPKIRGNYRSVPMERLVKRAEYLQEQGVKELILVAQETTVYGKDIYGEKSLPKLLRALCKVSGLRWYRNLLLSGRNYRGIDPGYESKSQRFVIILTFRSSTPAMHF